MPAAAILEMEETNEELVEACRRGEPDAFRALFESYKDRVYSLALRYCGDSALAQDIAQETFIKLFASIGHFRGDSKFESWLYRLVVNNCFDHRRKSRRLTPLFDRLRSILRSPSASALDEVMQTQMNGRIHSAVSALPPDQRMAVVLRYTQGLSYEEIAGITGCSPGTVGSRLNRAHKQLESRLSVPAKPRTDREPVHRGKYSV